MFPRNVKMLLSAVGAQGAIQRRRMRKVEFVSQPGLDEIIKGFSIDVLDYVSDFGVIKLRISGWIVAEGREIRDIFVNSGFRKTRIPVDMLREDVAAAFPNSSIPLHCGFSGTVFTAGLGSCFSLSVTAVGTGDNIDQGGAIWLGEILGRQPPATVMPVAHALAPICLTCYGRSGSTMMMHILDAHPQISVAGGYPYESRFAHSAFDHMAHSVQAGLRDRATYLDIPELAPECLAKLLNVQTAATVAMIDWFYTYVADSKGKTKTRYFAEKCPSSFLPNIVRDAYGAAAKEIILVRDPRDVFCSAMAFDEKRGTRDFGGEFATLADWFRYVQDFFVGLAKCHARRPHALVVRYEDILLDTPRAIAKVFRFLGVDDSADVAAAIASLVSQSMPEFSHHMTAATPMDSIGRWRAHRDAEIFNSGNQNYLEAMQAFGYV